MTTRRPFTLAIMAGTLLAAGLAGAAVAQTAPKTDPKAETGKPAAAPGAAVKPEDQVLARVDGAPITQKDLDIAAEDLGERLPAMAEAQKRDYVLSYVIDLRIGAKAALDAKVDAEPDFARRVAYFRDKVLLDDYLAREVKKAMTPEAARKLYDDTVANLKPEQEVRARHILVETEEEAKKVHARLKGGEDFAKVAGEVSKDPGSGKEGGDLGYFTRDRMVPEFAEAAFKLEPGQLSEPVKSQFGWHVIRLEDKRVKPLPTFEEVKDQVENYLARKTQQDLILALRAKAKIERLDKAEDKAPDAKPAEPKKP
ncbi:peptidylprolyl isomerase [Chelatococcus sp. SYSU_G07232]|uniref:Parvulin-like PPIase n=1 Tax=Chelatococcus albus TaxID=3047466 RepID=A0ABT7ADP0_9HYPH|nr:peptidylprolyl isomerase [Chelatococcus sp. SYSU_G07232]MDJ1157463.1 peptidylprolyl isomerase [Chelatococcus sp. SYSU_G07232]